MNSNHRHLAWKVIFPQLPVKIPNFRCPDWIIPILARLMATMNRCRRLERVIKEQKDTIRNYENGELTSGSNFAGRSRIVKPVFGGMTK